MTHLHPVSITIDDERYPGHIAEVLAMDCSFTRTSRTTTVLLRGTRGEFVVHLHTVPGGSDEILALDVLDAKTLYRQMHMHLMPYEVFDHLGE